MALDNEKLAGLTVEQLTASLIEYSVALDQSNTNITNFSNENIIQKDTIKTIKAESAKRLKKIEKLEADIDNLNLIISEKENGPIPISEDPVNSELTLEIDELKKLLVKKDSLIEKLKNGTDRAIIATAGEKIKIHSYNIKGYDNRNGLAINGGPIYIKAVVLVNYNDNFITWEIISLDLDIKKSIEVTLTPEQKIELDNKIIDIGSYEAIKLFIGIPDTVEKAFIADSILLNGI